MPLGLFLRGVWRGLDVIGLVMQPPPPINVLKTPQFLRLTEKLKRTRAVACEVSFRRLLCLKWVLEWVLCLCPHHNEDFN